MQHMLPILRWTVEPGPDGVSFGCGESVLTAGSDGAREVATSRGPFY